MRESAPQRVRACARASGGAESPQARSRVRPRDASVEATS